MRRDRAGAIGVRLFNMLLLVDLTINLQTTQGNDRAGESADSGKNGGDRRSKFPMAKGRRRLAGDFLISGVRRPREQSIGSAGK